MRVAPILYAAAFSLALIQAPGLASAEATPPPSAAAACAHAAAQEDEDNSGPDSAMERVASAKNPCAVADNNIARDEAEILREKPQAPAPAVKVWDHHTPPLFLEAIRRRFDLQPAELAVLDHTGFAVPARLEMPGYAQAYHEIFQSQLPVYITADSIFQAIFASHDSIVARLESTKLAPMLAQALTDMQCALPAAAGAYPAEVTRDLDLYLLVARRLLADPDGPHPRSAFADPAVELEADELVAKVEAADGLATITLFGRPRLVDFTQYLPRGHYAKDDAMQRYFRAAMWASRLEFNLVSRSSRSSAPGPAPDPSETPREAIDALALADLATRGGAAKTIADLDAAWAVLAGRREDVSIDALAAIRTAVGPLTDAQAFQRLKSAIGDRFHRTTRLHPMPEGSRELPAIATLLGPRIVADASALMPLVNSAVPSRDSLGVADIAYLFGLDRAKTYLAKDLATFPTLAGQFDVARAQLAGAPAGEDLYSAWLAAIRALARPAEGVLPSYLVSDAGQDLRLDTIAAAYGQLKHNYVLVAGQPYAEFGCEIPDGYVEPVPAAFDALIDYAARGAKLAALLDAKDSAGIRAHFERVGTVLRILHTIAQDELAGRSLSLAERRWLGMVAELDLNRSAEMTGYPPTYTGWYFDLFFERENDGMRGADYIADYLTGRDTIAYVGAAAPRLGIFVIDAGGPPRAFVGPVANAYETHGAIGTRFTDETARALAHKDAPWAVAYIIPAPAAPPSLQMSYDADAGYLVLTSDRPLGQATIKLLDHHRTAIATWQLAVNQGKTRLAIKKAHPEGFFIKLGDFRDFVLADAYGEIHGQWGKPPPEE